MPSQICEKLNWPYHPSVQPSGQLLEILRGHYRRVLRGVSSVDVVLNQIQLAFTSECPTVLVLTNFLTA